MFINTPYFYINEFLFNVKHMDRNDYEHSRPLDVHRKSKIKVKVDTKCFTVCFTLKKCSGNGKTLQVCTHIYTTRG